MPITRYLPAGDVQHYFEVTVAADGRIESRGVVKSALGTVIGERRLVVAPGLPVRQYRDASR